MGEHFIEEIQTSGVQCFRVGPIAVETVADIAALGGLDNQVFYDDSEAFEEFCAATQAVQLATRNDDVFTKFSVRILSHTGQWIHGTGQFCNEDRRSVWLEAESQIQGGTSGGPVIDDEGKLLGVVSLASMKATDTDIDPCNGSIAFASRALPVWLIEQISKG